MATRQTRIVVPYRPTFDPWWYESLLGRVVKPLVQEARGLEWFWFTHYGPYAREDGDWDDCDSSRISDAGNWPDDGFRSVRFRYQASGSSSPALEAKGSTLIESHGCEISDWRDWDLEGQLGDDRFVGEFRGGPRRRERASLVVSFLHTASVLTLHRLVGPDPIGRYRFELNAEPNNAVLRDTFQSLHHLACNNAGYRDGAQQAALFVTR